MHLTKRHNLFEIAPNKYILANGITGEILVVNQAVAQTLEAVKENNLAACDSRMLSELETRRFLFASEEDDDAAFVAACQPGWEAYRDHAPREYTFVVNGHCNFNCPYCFESEDLRARRNTLSEEQVDAAFRIIDEEIRERDLVKAPHLNLFGGEPLLPSSKPILGYILDRMAERKLSASVQTNGYHLASFIDFFRDHHQCVDTFQIGLDGPQVFHDQRRILKGGGGTYDRVLEGIDAFAASDLPIDVNIRINVDRDNVAALQAMTELYESKGWSADSRFYLTASPVYNRCGSVTEDKLLGQHELFQELFHLSTDTGKGPYGVEDYKALNHFRYYFSSVHNPERKKEPFVPRVVYCAAVALKYFLFHPDGRLYPCPESAGMENLAIGTYSPHLVLDPDKTALWTDQTIMNRKGCHDCSISTYCGGGCLMGSLMHYGDTHTPFCEEGPELVQLYFDEMRQTYQSRTSVSK